MQLCVIVVCTIYFYLCVLSTISYNLICIGCNLILYFIFYLSSTIFFCSLDLISRLCIILVFIIVYDCPYIRCTIICMFNILCTKGPPGDVRHARTTTGHSHPSSYILSSPMVYKCKSGVKLYVDG